MKKNYDPAGLTFAGIVCVECMTPLRHSPRVNPKTGVVEKGKIVKKYHAYPEDESYATCTDCMVEQIEKERRRLLLPWWRKMLPW